MNSLISSIVKDPKFEKKCHYYSNDLWEEIEKISAKTLDLNATDFSSDDSDDDDNNSTSGDDDDDDGSDDSDDVKEMGPISLKSIFTILPDRGDDVEYIKLGLKTVINYINYSIIKTKVGGITFTMKKPEAIRFFSSNVKHLVSLKTSEFEFYSKDTFAITVLHKGNPMCSIVFKYVIYDGIRIRMAHVLNSENAIPLAIKYFKIIIALITMLKIKIDYSTQPMYTDYMYAEKYTRKIFMETFKAFGIDKNKKVHKLKARTISGKKYLPDIYSTSGAKGVKFFPFVENLLNSTFNTTTTGTTTTGTDKKPNILNIIRSGMKKMSEGECDAYIYNYTYACEKTGSSGTTDSNSNSGNTYKIYMFSPDKMFLYASAEFELMGFFGEKILNLDISNVRVKETVVGMLSEYIENVFVSVGVHVILRMLRERSHEQQPLHTDHSEIFFLNYPFKNETNKKKWGPTLVKNKQSLSVEEVRAILKDHEKGKMSSTVKKKLIGGLSYGKHSIVISKWDFDALTEKINNGLKKCFKGKMGSSMRFPDNNNYVFEPSTNKKNSKKSSKSK